MDRVCRIPEDAKAGGRRDGLFEQLQVLGAQLQTLVRPSGNVAPGTCQATNDSAPYWIGGKAHDDWYRRGGQLRGKGGRSARGGDEVRLQTDEFEGERGEAICFPLGEPDLKNDVLAGDPAEVAESLLECQQVGFVTILRSLVEIADPPHLGRLLRLGGERRGEEGAGQAANECASGNHWITSSARSSSDSGSIAAESLYRRGSSASSTYSMLWGPAILTSITVSSRVAEKWATPAGITMSSPAPTALSFVGSHSSPQPIRNVPDSTMICSALLCVWGPTVSPAG